MIDPVQLLAVMLKSDINCNSDCFSCIYFIYSMDIAKTDFKINLENTSANT